MTLFMYVRHTLTLVSLLCLVAACKSGEAGPQLPINVIDFTGDAGFGGCSQRTFPEDQPDLSLLYPPRFLLTGDPAQWPSSGQVVADPGATVQAVVAVNSATRQALFELKDAWASEIPAIATQQIQTPGNEFIDVFFPTQSNLRPSRFYTKATLCGADCDERMVIYDIIAFDEDNQPTTGFNAPYARTLIENGEVVQVEDTCVNLDEDPGYGSGTILIQ